MTKRPIRIAVLSSVFPNSCQPTLGLFVRERMRRVAQTEEVLVIAPVAWFPGLGLLRRWRPDYRPQPPKVEQQEGLTVHHPRFLSLPRFLRVLDGLSEGLSAAWTLWRLGGRRRFDLIDAHFVQPDGVAARVAAALVGLPYTITLRGQLPWLKRTRGRRYLASWAMSGARRVFSVSSALKRDAEGFGIAPTQVDVMPNGVNLAYFKPEHRQAARARFGLALDDAVLVSVGGLTERKGFHRVIEVLPALLARFPTLKLLIAGGPSPEGDWSARLREQVAGLGLEGSVCFLGVVPPSELRFVYSAGDIFVLATRNEGWANVFLEACACGLPVVTTDVGGNAEVIPDRRLGTIVPFGNPVALTQALAAALGTPWDRDFIRRYAVENAWESRIPPLVAALRRAAGAPEAGPEAKPELAVKS